MRVQGKPVPVHSSPLSNNITANEARILTLFSDETKAGSTPLFFYAVVFREIKILQLHYSRRLRSEYNDAGWYSSHKITIA